MRFLAPGRALPGPWYGSHAFKTEDILSYCRLVRSECVLIPRMVLLSVCLLREF